MGWVNLGEVAWQGNLAREPGGQGTLGRVTWAGNLAVEDGPENLAGETWQGEHSRRRREGHHWHRPSGQSSWSFCGIRRYC